MAIVADVHFNPRRTGHLPERLAQRRDDLAHVEERVGGFAVEGVVADQEAQGAFAFINLVGNVTNTTQPSRCLICRIFDSIARRFEFR